MTNQSPAEQTALIELAMKFMSVRRAKDFQRHLSRHTGGNDMTTERSDGTRGDLESPRSPAEALRQQILKIRHRSCNDWLILHECQDCETEVDRIMGLVTAYAATVEREAAIRELKLLDKATRKHVYVEIDGYLADRLAALQGPRDGSKRNRVV